MTRPRAGWWPRSSTSRSRAVVNPPPPPPDTTKPRCHALRGHEEGLPPRRARDRDQVHPVRGVPGSRSGSTRRARGRWRKVRRKMTLPVNGRGAQAPLPGPVRPKAPAEARPLPDDAHCEGRGGQRLVARPGPVQAPAAQAPLDLGHGVLRWPSGIRAGHRRGGVGRVGPGPGRGSGAGVGVSRCIAPSVPGWCCVRASDRLAGRHQRARRRARVVWCLRVPSGLAAVRRERLAGAARAGWVRVPRRCAAWSSESRLLPSARVPAARTRTDWRLEQDRGQW